MDGDRIYWLDSANGDCRVGSASLDGTDVRTLATISSGRCGSLRTMALGDGYLYWNTGFVDVQGATIGRLSLNPPYGVQPDFIRVPGGLEVYGLVADGAWLYWQGAGVGRARLDGTDVEPTLFRQDNIRLLGVSQGYLWWQHGVGAGSIGRARLDGSHVERDFLEGIQLYDGAISGRWLYYTGSACDEPGCTSIDGTVRRIALESGAKPEFLSGGTGRGCRILDRSRPAGPPVLDPSNHEAPKRDRHRRCLDAPSRQGLGPGPADHP